MYSVTFATDIECGIQIYWTANHGAVSQWKIVEQLLKKKKNRLPSEQFFIGKRLPDSRFERSLNVTLPRSMSVAKVTEYVQCPWVKHHFKDQLSLLGSLCPAAHELKMKKGFRGRPKEWCHLRSKNQLLTSERPRKSSFVTKKVHDFWAKLTVRKL